MLHVVGSQSVVAERLESRKLMSTGVLTLAGAVVTYGTEDLIQSPFTLTSKGTLLVNGSGNADRITVYAKGNGGTVVFQDRGGTNTLTVAYQFRRSQVKRIRIDGGARNDVLRIDGDPAVPVTLLGGSGHDAIYGSPTGAETIFGNDGDDYIEAAHSTAIVFNTGDLGSVGGKWGFNNEEVEGSEIHGNLGNDTIMPSGAADTIFGGGGIDTVLVPNTSSIDLSDPSPGDTLESIELAQSSVPSRAALFGGRTIRLEEGSRL